MTTPIILLGSKGESTRIVYHELAKRFGAIPAIIEDRVSRKQLVRNRIRKLGLPSVASQLAFMILIKPLLDIMSRKRAADIKQQNNLDTSAIPESMISNVASVNAAETIELIARYRPKVVVVNGTRIISAKILSSTDATFINTHAGITPAYRGAHGGYWALYNRDPERCGVTVHLVDPGIDTGQIIDQSAITPTQLDSFVTYPYLQLAAALPLLSNAVERALNGTLTTRSTEGESAVWYHPGILQYLAGAIRGVR